MIVWRITGMPMRSSASTRTSHWVKFTVAWPIITTVRRKWIGPSMNSCAVEHLRGEHLRFSGDDRDRTGNLLVANQAVEHGLIRATIPFELSWRGGNRSTRYGSMARTGDCAERTSAGVSMNEPPRSERGVLSMAN